jgi:hypothetical protein
VSGTEFRENWRVLTKVAEELAACKSDQSKKKSLFLGYAEDEGSRFTETLLTVY